jgi:hypothetical protein
VIDAADGRRMQVDDLLRRMASADFVLLGELHDNPSHHEVRGSSSLRSRHAGPPLSSNSSPKRVDR